MGQRLPEDELPGNNCYGQLTARSGLTVVADLFDSPGWRTRLSVSAYSGAETLELGGPGLELQSDHVREHRHLIAGEVEPSERGRASLRWFSARLEAAGVAHRLELYVPETTTLLDSYECGWSGADAW